MMKSRWITVAVLFLCLLLLLTACSDNTPVAEMQNTAGALNTSEVIESSAAPITVSTAEVDSPSNKAGLTYDLTMKAAKEKAELLTAAYDTNSVQYTLIDHGNIVISGQFGKNDEQGQKPLTTDTMYGIGSTSKMFTTVAVMQLVDQGKIDLDTPVVHYIPEFRMKDERYKQITPRMLLNHSSGLNGSTFTNAYLFEDIDTYAHDTLLKQLAGQTLKADPGAY
nr:serine hydrolase domain-containing protein [Paenibacillus sp. FSL H7-0357]